MAHWTRCAGHSTRASLRGRLGRFFCFCSTKRFHWAGIPVWGMDYGNRASVHHDEP